MICGDLYGVGSTLKFEKVEDIVDDEIELLLEKFGDINYITLTNPIDAWPPEVLDSVTKEFEAITLDSGASVRPSGGKAAQKLLGTFTIPEDYKYALVKFEGINLDDEDVDEFDPGDQIWVPRKADRNYWEIFRETMLVAAQVATVYLVIETARTK